MRKVIVATIVFFTGVLVVCWVVAERAHPKFIHVDAAAEHR
jgi:hypothetical protein